MSYKIEEIIEKLSKPLSKDDVELRIGTTKAKGFSLLLYKTARTDVKRLNESGAIWKNSHEYDKAGLLTCSISIYSYEINNWVIRTDVGTESMTEKEKGLYSDSFKRAGFRWGIGLELYHSPFIWINWKMTKRGNSYTPENFYTSSLEIDKYKVENGAVTEISIKYAGEEIFSYPKNKTKVQKISQEQVLEIEELISITKTEKDKFLQYFKVKKVDDLSSVSYLKAKKILEKKQSET